MSYFGDSNQSSINFELNDNSVEKLFYIIILISSESLT